MTATSFTDPIPHPYNSAGTSVQIAADYTTFFTHTNTADCPLTSCVLNKATCGGAAGTAVTTRISIGASPTYGITAIETESIGYSV